MRNCLGQIENSVQGSVMLLALRLGKNRLNILNAKIYPICMTNGHSTDKDSNRAQIHIEMLWV